MTPVVGHTHAHVGALGFSQCPTWCRMIYAVLSSMLVAAAALVPGAEAAGSRNLQQFSASNFASQGSNNGETTTTQSRSQPEHTVTHDRVSSSVSCRSRARSFTIADSKDAHVEAGVSQPHAKLSASFRTDTL
jgi:hypothetical protein